MSEATRQFFAPRAACNETRSWEEIATEARSMTNTSDRYISGGLGKLAIRHRFQIWVCWRNHPCVAAVGGGAGDRMCYVINSVTKGWHAWDLESKLGLC